MYQIIAFLGYLASISVVGGGILYCYDKEKFNELSQKLSWETVKCYHKVNNTVKNAIKDLEKQQKRSIELTKTKNIKIQDSFEFYGYKINSDTEFMCNINNLNSKRYYIDDTDFDIMFIKKIDVNRNIFWKRILEKDILDCKEKIEEFEPIDKPFLQIEYCVKTDSSEPVQKTEIHTEILPFYIKNSVILDKPFIQWYVNKYYSLASLDDYELQLIDTNINIFKINNNESCYLEETNDKPYLIKQNEN